MKLQYLDHGFYHISQKTAKNLCNGKLPKHGYEKIVECSLIDTTNGYVWVSRTKHNGKMVWSIRNAGNVTINKGITYNG